VRYGKEHKQATRRRIVETAGRRFKRDGIDGSGLVALMADAGLSVGAFYGHFASKDELVATAVADQLREQRESICAAARGGAGIEEIVRSYLSPDWPIGGSPTRYSSRGSSTPLPCWTSHHRPDASPSSMHSDRKAAGHIAKAAGARSLVVDFRLAPEPPSPRCGCWPRARRRRGDREHLALDRPDHHEPGD
jgi:AcrR family transcriptional regulator